MKAMTMAVMLLQMSSAGGAGAEAKRAAGHAQEKDAGAQGEVTQEIHSLQGQITSLKEEFKLARERQRLAAEEKKRQEEAKYGVPAKPTPPPGRSRAPAHQ
jgi:hypothetical protein